MSKRILVIDDDEAVRKSFVLALKDSEYHLRTAESPEQAIETNQVSDYDLIFLGPKIPGLNGVTTLRELRKTYKNTPVYMMMPFHEDAFDQIESALEKGMDFEILRKPVSRDQIALVMKSIFEGPMAY